MHVVPQRVRPRTLPFLRFMRELGLSSMIHEVLHRLAICGITLLTGDVQSITLHGKAWPLRHQHGLAPPHVACTMRTRPARMSNAG